LPHEILTIPDDGGVVGVDFELTTRNPKINKKSEKNKQHLEDSIFPEDSL
jgi:hypothetical protein